MVFDLVMCVYLGEYAVPQCSMLFPYWHSILLILELGFESILYRTFPVFLIARNTKLESTFEREDGVC